VFRVVATRTPPLAWSRSCPATSELQAAPRQVPAARQPGIVDARVALFAKQVKSLRIGDPRNEYGLSAAVLERDVTVR